jgi:hypothetical protein
MAKVAILAAYCAVRVRRRLLRRLVVDAPGGLTRAQAGGAIARRRAQTAEWSLRRALRQSWT